MSFLKINQMGLKIENSVDAAFINNNNLLSLTRFNGISFMKKI